VYIHAYIDTYIHTYTYIYTYIHTYIHAYIHTHIHTCVHTYIHMYMNEYIHMCIHACIHTYKHTYMHTFMHTYIYTHANTHTHARVSVQSSLYKAIRFSNADHRSSILSTAGVNLGNHSLLTTLPLSWTEFMWACLYSWKRCLKREPKIFMGIGRGLQSSKRGHVSYRKISRPDWVYRKLY